MIHQSLEAKKPAKRGSIFYGKEELFHWERRYLLCKKRKIPIKRENLQQNPINKEKIKRKQYKNRREGLPLLKPKT